MNILVTGSRGMLGKALTEVLAKDRSHKVTGVDIVRRKSGVVKGARFEACDITDPAALEKVTDSADPDIIIHAAAFTDVDGCELDSGKAGAVNGVGTRYVAEAAGRAGARLIYISTDFVFDGRKGSPYTEKDVPNPLNVYGRTKLDGETSVTQILKGAKPVIIRTSWLFGHGGKNFVDTVLRKAKQEKELRIVSDQFGSPTYAGDLASAIAAMTCLIGRNGKGPEGIYHITNSDDCSWYRLAQKALKLSSAHDVKLVPIVSLELDRPAERPAASVLDNSRYIKLSGRPLRVWEKALEEYLRTRRR